MTISPEDQKMAEFFDWLKPRLKMPELTAVPQPPGDNLLKLVRESAKAFGGKALKQGRYEESLTLLAADDGNSRDGAVRLTSVSGKWDLTREILHDDPDWVILRLKCKDSYVAEMQGSFVEVEINGQIYQLGEINRRGVAEAEVPSGLDLSKAIVRIDKSNA